MEQIKGGREMPSMKYEGRNLFIICFIGGSYMLPLQTCPNGLTDKNKNKNNLSYQ